MKVPVLNYVNITVKPENWHEATRQHCLYCIKIEASGKVNVSSKTIKKLIEKRIKFEEEYCGGLNGLRGCTFQHRDDFIYLNLKTLHNDFPINTEKHICDTISHETIHLVLRILDGQNACSKYDNIYLNLRHDGYGGC